jgi:hypothetical protein
MVLGEPRLHQHAASCQNHMLEMFLADLASMAEEGPESRDSGGQISEARNPNACGVSTITRPFVCAS